MGHGKSTVLKSYLKYISRQSIKVPVLIAVREKQLAHEIYNEVSSHSPGSIINIDSENKHTYEDDLSSYQIIIIQHQRLKNLSLGFGNLYNYQYYIKDKVHWGKSDTKEKVKRILIVDEKPDFTNSAIFDIGSKNNVLDWFDDLSHPLGLLPLSTQKYKSYIVFLLSEQLAENNTDITTKLINDEDKKTKRAIDLLSKLKEMSDHKENQSKYESLNKLLHFKKLLTENDYGRIDDYEIRGHTGRKIIVSKLVDYSKLGMNTLVFDGTARINPYQYSVSGFKGKLIKNRNDYKRLFLQIDCISTTKYSREKAGYTTQKAITKRIKELQQHNKDIFILPTKSDTTIYKQLEAIKKSDYKYYEDIDNGYEKGINLLNTTGKNVLKDKKSLYLTSLPKRNADHYKEIAISLYDSNVTLLTNQESDNGNWFNDDKLEKIYRGDLYAELLQIIHRTSLRYINDDSKIIIYIAYDEESDKYTYDGKKIVPVSENLKHNYFNNDCTILPHYQINDISLYGRDKKLEGFIGQINKAFIERGLDIDPIPLSKVSSTFSKYIRVHWTKQSKTINDYLNEQGYEIIEKKDRYSNNSRYIDTI
jgi:hypothetical protein